MRDASRLMVVFSLAMAGCSAIPPAPQTPTLTAEMPLAQPAPGGGGVWPQKDWWRRYQDPTLDQLIDTSLASAPSLKTAHARFDTARESVRLAGAASGAQVALAGDMDRQRLSDNGLFPPQLLGFHWYNLANLGLQVNYTFDWWGKQHAAIAAALDQAHAAQAEQSAAELLLASSIADTYFGWQADQQRLAIAQQNLAVAERAGRIAAERLQADLEPADVVHHADSAVAVVREQIAILEGSARLRVVALAALCGRAESELPALQRRPLPAVVTNVPDNVRLDLIARRADIVASRWRVEATHQNLRSARAQFFPDISINALAGVSAIDLAKLLEYGSRVPQAGIALHLPVFDAGTLSAQYRGTEAQLHAAIASYDQTLIDAARDVATQLANRQQMMAQREQRLIEAAAAEKLRSGAAAQVRQGLVDARVELTAAGVVFQQRDALLQLDAQALSADIGLQRALGGGYDMQQDFPNSPSSPKQSTP
jgi:outer membrane protein, multidrug efflux system